MEINYKKEVSFLKKKYVIASIIFLALVSFCAIVIFKPSLESAEVSGKNIESKEEKNIEKEIYKVNKEDLLKKLSKSEKEELDKILKNISSVDIGKIEQYMSNNDSKKDMKDALSLLNKRLGKDDYNKVIEILSPYVDLRVFN